MQFKVKCSNPACAQHHTVDVDTSGCRARDTFNDLVECACGEAFILRTTVTANAEVLPVAGEKTNLDYRRRRELKGLLQKIEKLLTA